MWFTSVFVFRACLSYCLVSAVISWERTDVLALLYVMFSCVLVTLPNGVLGQVWYLILTILFLNLVLVRFGSRIVLKLEW